MDETLDLPAIDPAALEPSTAMFIVTAPTVADAAKAFPAPASIKDAAIAHLRADEPAIRALAERYRAVALDLSTPKGMAAGREARHDLRENGRYALQRKRDQTKDLLNAAKSDVEAEADRLIALVKPVEDHVHGQIEARQKVLDAEKAERDRLAAEVKRKDDERKALHQEGITKIRNYATQAAGLSAERIAKGIAQLESMVFTADAWQEFAVPAANAACETIETLRQMHRQALEREAAAAAAEAQRIENTRLAAELAEQRLQIEEQRAELARQQQAIADAAAAEKEKQAREQAERQAELIERGRVIVDDIIAAEVIRDAMKHEPSNEAKHYGGAIRGASFAVDRPTAMMNEPLCATVGPTVNVTGPATITDSRPPIKLGDVNERLGFTMTAAFVTGKLKVPPIPDPKGRAVLFAASDVPAIYSALIKHIEDINGRALA